MRKAYSLLVTLLITFSCNLWAMNAELFPTKATQVKEGDIVEATLRIWPLEQSSEEQLKKLEGQTFFQSLFLYKINIIAPSENNADVTEVTGSFIVRGPKITAGQTIEINNEIVSVLWKGPEIQSLASKNKDYFILNQSTVASMLWMIVAAVAVAFAALAFVFRKRIAEFFKKKKNKTNYTPDYFNQLFTNASGREDFERIYALKEYWLPLLKIQTPAHGDFFKVLNQHQYKKHWGSDEINETKTSFEMIRRSFSS